MYIWVILNGFKEIKSKKLEGQKHDHIVTLPDKSLDSPYFFFIFKTFYMVDLHWRHQNYERTHRELCSLKNCDITQRILYILDSSK